MLFFEFALRVGASILYIMIQSMKCADPSLRMGDVIMTESMKAHLVSRWYDTINPMYFRPMFELLLVLLERRLWREYDRPILHQTLPQPEVDKTNNVAEYISENAAQSVFENFQKKLMEERFGEMERIYTDPPRQLSKYYG